MAPPPPPPSLTFPVRRCQPELIAPAKPTPREIKKLSEIDDQEGLLIQVQFIMFYRSLPSMKGKDPVKIIREALSEALVYYYPYAGRLIEGPNKKLMVNCNGEGILFIEADADVSMEQLGDSIQPPCPCIDELLFDVPGSANMLGCPLLLIQVTRLTCGEFIFAIRLNHTMSDAIGLVKFLNATTEFARGARTPSLFPVWQREILCARNPPRITCAHHEYEQIKEINSKSILTLDQPNMVHRSFFFGSKDIKSLRNYLPPHLRNCSTFEVLAACSWKCRTEAFQLEPNEITRVLCVINLRVIKGLQVPIGYYGNAIAFVAAITTAELLCKNPLGYAVELIRKSKNRMDEEYVRSVLDLMETKGRPHYTTEWNFLASDNSHVGLVNIDFGWGKPIYGGPMKTLPYVSFYARLKNSKGENGIVVSMLLPEPVMERFEEQVLKMTSLESNGIIHNTLKSRITSML